VELRTKRARIERLRKRLDDAMERPAAVVGVVKGMLDLLEDEL
jgi:hypothetical protein